MKRTPLALIFEVIEVKYVSPMLFYRGENPFQQEVREYRWIMDFHGKHTINIYIPEGYTIEKVLDPIFIAMQENLGSFRFNANVVGNQIQISIINQINTAIIPPEYYSKRVLSGYN
jgi:hypothetical protein